MKKKKLLLCIHRYPTPLPPASRWTPFLEYLTQRSWSVLILSSNWKMKKEMPANIINGVEAAEITSCGQFLRRFLKKLVPNLEKYRINKFVIKFGALQTLLKNIVWICKGIHKGFQVGRNCDVLISTCFPLSPHLITLLIKKKYNKPWILDMADPWTLFPSRKIIPKWRFPFDKIFEAKCLRVADKILFTTEETSRAYHVAYKWLSEEKTAVIPCGYDGKISEIKPEQPLKFRVVYTGAFYTDIRSPIPLFEALNTLRTRDIEIYVAGNIARTFTEIVHEKNLDTIVKFLGVVKHETAISLQKGASVLLLIGNTGGLQIPSKIFEYFAACRPILAIKNAESDLAADLVSRYNRGIVVKNDCNQIASAMDLLMSFYKKSELEGKFDLTYIEEFHSDNMSKKINEILIKLIK